MQAGTFKLERKKVAIHTLLKDFYDEALFLSREKNISVVLGQGPKAFIDGDESRIRQVLFNLLDNAIKHTPEKGRIRLNYEIQGEDVVVHFADTGPGIPPSELSKIFDPFHRVDSTNNGARGAGLGLSLVKWLVEAHGGTVSVESELGRGTKFSLRFPSVPEA
jgi:signal transduction histidine kinase